jgi:hypothetical protein
MDANHIVCNVWDLITFIKFQAFPFTPDELKQRVCKQIVHINTYNQVLHTVIGPMLSRNTFFEFERFIRRYRRMQPGYFNASQKDLDVLMEIFWAEENEGIAHRMMRAFMVFDISSDELRAIWNVALNILYSKTGVDDTIAALTLLEAHSGSLQFDSSASHNDTDYIVIERKVASPPISEPLQPSSDKNDGTAEFLENLS